jgi:hypothetical protein
MSLAYRTIYHSFFKEHVQAITRGQFWLSEESACTLGEPMILHESLTGFVSTPKKKKRIVSYPSGSNAGAKHAIGISLDIRSILSGVTSDDIIMRPAYYYPREIAIMTMGICKIINMAASGTTAAAIDETALPIDGGAVPLSFASAHSGSGFVLGKWMEETYGQEAGLVFVDPKAEVLP